MQIAEIRKLNLRRLISEAGSQVELAKICSVSRTYLSQVLHSYPGATGKDRAMGDRLARKLERGMKRPTGWMDQINYREDRDAVPPSQHEVAAVPVRGTAVLDANGIWEDVTEGPNGVVKFPTDDPEAYALRIKGSAYAPAIRDGWFVGVEPTHDLVPGEFVLVTFENGTSVLRELLWARDDQILVSDILQENRQTIYAEQYRHAYFVGAILSPSKFLPAK